MLKGRYQINFFYSAHSIFLGCSTKLFCYQYKNWTQSDYEPSSFLAKFMNFLEKVKTFDGSQSFDIFLGLLLSSRFVLYNF